MNEWRTGSCGICQYWRVPCLPYLMMGRMTHSPLGSRRDVALRSSHWGWDVIILVQQIAALSPPSPEPRACCTNHAEHSRHLAAQIPLGKSRHGLALLTRIVGRFHRGSGRVSAFATVIHNRAAFIKGRRVGHTSPHHPCQFPRHPHATTQHPKSFSMSSRTPDRTRETVLPSFRESFPGTRLS